MFTKFIPKRKPKIRKIQKNLRKMLCKVAEITREWQF